MKKLPIVSLTVALACMLIGTPIISASAKPLNPCLVRNGLYIKDTALQGLELKVCQVAHKYKIDAEFITAVMVHESDYGTSRIAQDKNNLFGLNAVDGDPYNQAYSFATREDSIEYFGRMIRTSYIGKRDSSTVQSIGRYYASDGKWAKKVINIMAEIKGVKL